MSYQIQLPKDVKQAEDVIASLIARGKALRNPKAVRWLIALSYMQGARNIDSVDYTTGTVRFTYENTSGRVQFQFEQIVSMYQAQLGRLLGLDISPVVSPRGISLDGLRKSSIAQMALSAIMPDDKINQLRLELFPFLLLCGTIGVGAWYENEDAMGIEVIPPWEILPLPIDGSGNVRGYIRRRFVPVDWIERLPMTPDKRASVYKEMEKIQVPAGQLPSEIKSRFADGLPTTVGGEAVYTHAMGQGDAGAPQKKDETMIEIAEYAEVWTKTPDGCLAEYRIHAGKKEVYRHDFSKDKVHLPIGHITDIDVGSFWGRAYIDLLIPMNIELENSIGSLFQNIQDLDLYGLLLEPTNLGIPAEIMRGSDGLKRIRYEPDYTTPTLAPDAIRPQNTGLWPIKAIETAMGLMNSMANQPTALMQGNAPGRVDSSSGLGFLYETSGVPLIPTAKNVSAGLNSCYKALLGFARERWSGEKVLSVSHLDDNLAGIKFDPSSGVLSLEHNPLPHPDEVVIRIASEIPRSLEREKLELKEARTAGILTPTEYIIEVRKRGLDLPTGGEYIWQNYRRAMLENLMLFNDGETPGKGVIVSPRDHHPTHLMVLDAFMARPEFYLASAIVRTKFGDHHDEHESGLGKIPDQMPNIEEAAEMVGQQFPEEMMGGGQPVQ